MPRIVLGLIGDFLQLLALGLRSHTHLAAQNLFIRKQLAFTASVGGSRAASTTSRDSRWSSSPDSSSGGASSRLSNRRRSCDGPSGLSPGLAVEVTAPWPSAASHAPAGLIAEMTRANRMWGEERIAAELLLEPGISLSPRTVRRDMARPSRPVGARRQIWGTFPRNHAREVLACDFFVTVTASFRLIYVFVVLDISTRRLVHWNVTEHPTSEWTIQHSHQGQPVTSFRTGHRVAAVPILGGLHHESP